MLLSIATNILHVFWEIEQVPKEEYLKLEERLIPLLEAVLESSGQERLNALKNLIVEFRSLNPEWGKSYLTT